MKAVICGAGMAGLSCAYFLARLGWETTVLERASGLRTAGYMIDFFGSGYDAAEAGGLLLPRVDDRTHLASGPNTRSKIASTCFRW